MAQHIIDSPEFLNSHFCKKNYPSYIRGYTKKYDQDFLTKVTHCFNMQDFSEAKNIINTAISILQNEKTQTKDKKRHILSNWISAIKSLLHFADSFEQSGNEITTMSTIASKISATSQIRVKKYIKKVVIDGSEALISQLGGVKEYLKLALTDSYFFCKVIVRQRVNEILGLWEIGESIPVRKSNTGQYIYKNCCIDKDGNSNVRSNITKYTGYLISAGKNSNFLNYRISHLYGNASDPRYFSNFWNIVLVPEWANGLLEKDSAEAGTHASQVLNTYKAICNQLYSDSIMQLNELGAGEPISLYPQQPKDVIHGTYNIKVLLEKEDSFDYSKIETRQITI